MSETKLISRLRNANDGANGGTTSQPPLNYFANTVQPFQQSFFGFDDLSPLVDIYFHLQSLVGNSFAGDCILKVLLSQVGGLLC